MFKFAIVICLLMSAIYAAFSVAARTVPHQTIGAQVLRMSCFTVASLALGLLGGVLYGLWQLP